MKFDDLTPREKQDYLANMAEHEGREKLRKNPRVTVSNPGQKPKTKWYEYESN